MTDPSSYQVLIRAASSLFRQRGYDGVGLNEILKAADLPKGSLYHHFPGGKRELAEAATLAAGDSIMALADRVFLQANDFAGGGAGLCRALARAIAQRDRTLLACPVFSILQAGAREPHLREAGRKVFALWIDHLAAHGARLGHPAPAEAAEMLLIQLEGAWMLALAEESGAPFERLADRLIRRALDAPEAV